MEQVANLLLLDYLNMWQIMNEQKIPMIDSHMHLHDVKFDHDRVDVIARAHDAGMVQMITVGTNQESSQRAVDLAHAEKDVFATIGLHPLHLFSASNCDPEEQFIEEFDHDFYYSLAQDDRVVAIGEVGLDYHHFGEGDDIEMIKEKQREVFKECIVMCNDVRKPIVVHCWDGYEELVDILTQFPVEKRGVIHSYIGSWKNAEKFIALGYKIGVNGIVTYGDSYDKLLRNIDLKDLLIETDCPYLPPRPLPRENRCEPRDVYYVAQKIADVKDLSTEEILQTTTKNAKEVFHI